MSAAAGGGAHRNAFTYYLLENATRTSDSVAETQTTRTYQKIAFIAIHSFVFKVVKRNLLFW